MRQLEWWEIQRLGRQGCRAADWNEITVSEDTDLSLLSDVTFEGKVEIGAVKLLSQAKIVSCTIGDGCFIRHCSLIYRARIGKNVFMENVGNVIYEPECTCGIGVEVNCLDETGSTPVYIYPGLSAQMAMLMARKPRWTASHLKPLLEEHFLNFVDDFEIGDGATVTNVRLMQNVIVGREVKVEGASRLVNGRIVNNCGIKGRCLAYVGADVDAENFIIEDGVADGGVYIRNCYVGQGAVIDKRFTAHDSLFFANCACENGEACAIFAGPYTVTMHKSSLLIGAVTSFMNAGSGTNQSNHMYKLGPIHWGVMERGVKTSSDSYIMWGARIGAFSLLMGTHKNHPDSHLFPFSYLFGDAKGTTTLVPAKMLKSCGLMRDELKWPTRDLRRKRKLPLNDRIIFSVLTPYTVGAMDRAVKLCRELILRGADDDLYIRHKGMKMLPAHLDRGAHLYNLAIMKYLSEKVPDGNFPEPDPELADIDVENWVDLGGQLMPRSYMAKAMAAETLEEAEAILTEAYENYDRLEREWMARHLVAWKERMAEVPAGKAMFDRMVEEDRAAYRASVDDELKMLEL